MKLTDQHVSDEWINWQIAYLERFGCSSMHPEVVALLELKQRRAEDRQIEKQNC